MKVVILFSILFSPLFASSQNKFGIHGSFIIAAIGSDGIMIAADTRGAFYDTRDAKETTLAYYDTIQKIIPANNFVVGNMGNAIIGGKSIYTLINLYLQDSARNVSIDSFVSDFLKFYKENVPLSLYKLALKNCYISIGYNKKTPKICIKWFPYNQDTCMANYGYVLTDERCQFGAYYNSKKNCAQLAELAEKYIYSFAKQYNQQYTIGGPIMIIKVSKDNIVTWLKNKPKSKPYATSKDFINAYFENKLRVHFIKPDYKKRVEFIMNPTD